MPINPTANITHTRARRPDGEPKLTTIMHGETLGAALARHRKGYSASGLLVMIFPPRAAA